MRWYEWLALGAVAAVLAFGAGSCVGDALAQGAGFCLDREDAAKALSRQHGEVQVGRGLANDTLVELWVDPADGSWTILLTNPAGRSCPAAAGQDWHFEVPEAAGDPA